MEVGTEGRRGWIVVLPGEVTLAGWAPDEIPVGARLRGEEGVQ